MCVTLGTRRKSAARLSCDSDRLRECLGEWLPIVLEDAQERDGLLTLAAPDSGRAGVSGISGAAVSELVRGH